MRPVRFQRQCQGVSPFFTFVNWSLAAVPTVEPAVVGSPARGAALAGAAIVPGEIESAMLDPMNRSPLI